MKTYQIVLSVPLCSGRGVRFKQLAPTERDKVASRAAKDIDETATTLDFRLTELREGVKAMLVAVTREPVIATAPSPANDPRGPRDPRGAGVARARPTPAPAEDADPLANDALWEPVDVGKLTMPGPFSYDALFTPKDDDLLCKVYQRYHEVKPDEVEAIVGKALEVSAA
jgi:hypothetical protein